MTESVRPHDPRALNALKHGLAVSVVPEHELEAFGRLRARRGLYERTAHLLSEQIGRASSAADDDLERYKRVDSPSSRDRVQL